MSRAVMHAVGCVVAVGQTPHDSCGGRGATVPSWSEGLLPRWALEQAPPALTVLAVRERLAHGDRSHGKVSAERSKRRLSEMNAMKVKEKHGTSG